jgi:hypothetical protein
MRRALVALAIAIAMHYDPAAQQVIVFGGYQPNVRDRGDTWAWSGSGWTEQPPEAAARTHARMAYDANLGALVAVGGGDGGPTLVRRAGAWSAARGERRTARPLPARRRVRRAAPCPRRVRRWRPREQRAVLRSVGVRRLRVARALISRGHGRSHRK